MIREDLKYQYNIDLKGKIPIWKKKKDTQKMYCKNTALGVLHNYMNEKLETMNQLYGNEKQRNKYIMELIRKEEAKNNVRVYSLRGELRDTILQSNKEVSEKMQTNADASWFNHHYHQWRKKLFDVDSEDEKRLIASLLYEQTADLSVLKSTDEKEIVSVDFAGCHSFRYLLNTIVLMINIFFQNIQVYKFAWMVGHDTLIQIINSAKSKDGDAKGSPITMTLDIANAVCSSKKF